MSSSKLSILAAASLAVPGFAAEKPAKDEAPVNLFDQSPITLTIDSRAANQPTQIYDVDFSTLKLTAPPVVIYVDRPVATETHAVSRADEHAGDWEKKSHFLTSLLSAGLIGGGAILMYKRWLPHVLHVNMLQPGYPEASFEKDPKDLSLVQTTVLSSSLPAIYHHDIPAFIKFYGAMVNGYRHPHWPIANFSNSAFMRAISGGYASEVVAPELLAAMSAEINIDDAIFTARAANARIANGHPPKFVGVDSFFTCITFEKTETRQPRAYFMPMPNVVDMLVNFKDWWQATKNSGSADLKQKMSRQVEMGISLIWRYPEAFKNFFGFHQRAEEDPVKRRVNTAVETASHLLKILSLEPKESAEFLDAFFEGKDIAQPTESDFRKIYKAFYGTKDPEKQEKLLEIERGLTKLSNYNHFCREHELPMWFMLFNSIRK